MGTGEADKGTGAVGLSALHKNSWLIFRLALTGLLLGLLIVGRVPMAGATEEDGTASEAQVTDAEAEGTDVEPAAEPAATEEPAEEPAATEQPAAEPEVTEAPAPPAEEEPATEEVPAPVEEDPAPKPEPQVDEPADEASTSDVPLPYERTSAARQKGDTEALFSAAAVGASASLDQWGNLAGSWQNGNLNTSNSKYAEGDTVPFRAILGGLGAAGTQHTITIEWDTMKNGAHAYDYLRTFNASESANPCVAQPGCVLASPDSTFGIPTDPQVTVAQAAGNFTLWGGTIDSVSAYGDSGPLGGTDSQRITITFTSSSTKGVLAWGGHISTRVDYPTPGKTASKISGSPYHMRVLEIDGSGGNQDRSLSAAAVFIPDIRVDKTADYSAATVGTLVTYSYEITNNGELPLINITLTDDKLGAITPLPKTSLAVGESMTATKTYTITAADLAGSPLVNEATVSGFTAGGANPTDTDTWSITVAAVPVPNMAFSKTDDSGGAVSADGGTFEYELVATNQAGATADATGVEITDTVPAGLTILSVTTTRGTCAPPAGQDVTCDIGTLTPGQSATVTISVEADGSVCDEVTNQAEVTGNFTTLDDDTTVQLTCPDPSFTKTSNAPAGGVEADGGSFEYVLTLANDAGATGTAVDVVITDTMPAGLDITSATWTNGRTGGNCSVVGQDVTCNVGDVAPGGSAVATIAVTADGSVCGPITNDGAVSGDNVPADTATVTVTLLCPDVDLSKTASSSSVGTTDPFSYEITADNSGDGIAQGLVISDDLDDDLTLVDATYSNDGGPDTACATGAGNTVDCGPMDLAAGTSAVVTINVVATAAACGDVENTASSNFSPDSNTVIVVIACPAQPAAIRVVKTAATTDPDIGGIITYSYKITNTGKQTLTSITLHDDKLGSITLPTGTLLSGQNMTVTVDHIITAANVDAGSLTNVATVTGLDPAGTPVTDTSTATVDLPQNPGIEIVKTADKAAVDVGEVITYTYVVTNTGNVTLADISVADDVIGMILDGAVGRSLGAGESLTLVSPYEATEADGVAGGVTNVATAGGSPPSGAPVTHTDTVTVPVGTTEVEPTGFLTVTKTVVGDHAGQAYRYSVDCGTFALGKEATFSLPAAGGTHQLGVAIETGTQCKVVETGAGGADATTVSVNNGADQASRSAVATIRLQGSTVAFTNLFDVDPDVVPRPDPEPDPTLPATGSAVSLQLLVALGALLLGAILVRTPRRRSSLRG